MYFISRNLHSLYCIVFVAMQIHAVWDHKTPSSSRQTYGVCVLGLDKLWLFIVVYGLSASLGSALSLSLLRLPRWVCLLAGAAIHTILLVVFLALPLKPNDSRFLVPLLVIVALWGLGTALNKTGLSSKCRRCLRWF